MSHEAWSDYPDDSDPPAPARGVMVGLLIALPIWAALAWPVARLIVWVWR